LKRLLHFSTLLLILFVHGSASAIPRFSLLTGTRCSACHFNPQGSGIRTTLGWEMMNETGMIKWHGPNEQDTFAVPFPENNNTIFSKHLYWGGDARFQLVRESKTNQELLIPMQLSGELAYQASPELVAYTNINFASLYVRSLKTDTSIFGKSAGLYPGETDYDLALQYQPSQTLPSLRVGMIEPTVSIRQDDHTEYVHEEAALQGIALIPPYYNDIGAELTYEGIRWLTINAGIFNAYNLAQVDPTIGTVTSHFDFSKPTISARVMGWPQSLDLGLNGEIGGSVLMNGAFHMYNGFVGVGLADKSSIYFEGMYAKNADERIIRNFSVLGSMELVQWLALEWRYDYGQTELYAGRDLGFSNAFLLGLEYFPLPYIELRPEYRVTQKNPLTGTGTFTGQWTGQIHIFY
jgi:hypothetical protein